MSFRQLASKMAETHNRFGGSVVGVKGDGKDLLDQIGELELRIPVDGPIFTIEESHLTRKQIRESFWELRKQREWILSRGVVWSSSEGGTSHVGMGEVVPPGTPKPALTEVVTLGGKDG